MAKTSKGVILSQASQIKSDYSFALIKATADNKSLVQDASSAELKVNALVEYSKDSQWDPKKLTSLGFPAGCFLIVDLRGQDIHAADLITNLALVRQYGYQAGVIDDLSTLDDIKALKANQIYLINSGKTNDDQDASLNGNEITDGSGKLAVGMSVKWQRDYTNVDVSGDHAGFVGMGQDTLLKGGNAFGYSTNGRDFNAVITPKGLIFRRPDAERMWRLLKPNEIADINSTVGDKVKKEVDSATAEIPAAVSAANSAVSAAESIVAASKVNSDAIAAQSEAISEAKSAMDSATAEIQQTAANAASDAAKITANSTQITRNKQAIALKADQTEVDKVKGTASQNSSRLDVMAGEIKSKVTSTDVNNIVDKKGYATTSTVQSLITQKAGTINESITNLDAKYKARDGVNLATETGNVSLSGGYNSSKNIGYISLDTINDLCGKYMTISVDVEWSGWKSGNQNRVGYELQINYDDGSTEYDGCWLTPTTANGKQRVTATYKIKDQHVQSLGKGNAYIQINCTSAKVSHLKIERGTVATPWTPAPSDNATVTQLQSITASIDGVQSNVTNLKNDTSSKYTQLSNLMQSKVGTADFDNLKRAVDMQTLDSADINNMKTNGHYFVRNLANNPIGGWVYVDITGNGADRIRQDVYQDNGSQHKYRRWFGNSWTDWSQGATESEITQLRDDINLRVKSGDLLSQINLTAHNTLIQSNKIYLDSSSTVFSGKAFIPSAAIVNLDVAKLNAGTINTDRIHIGDDSVYLSVKNNYLRLDGSNTKDKYQLRLTGNDIEFADNDSSNWEYRIQHGISKYQTDEDGLDFDVYSKRGGANHTVMAVSDAGVMISPSLFFQTDGIDSSNWMGFTRNTVNGNSSVSFHTWDDNNEGFQVDCGARFLNYVYINGYARAQGWLTNSTLSKKTNIRKLDNQIALDKIRQDDQYLYEYKRNVAKGIYDPQASFIIDDVNDVAQYSVPREFIDQTGNYREPNVELAYLVAAFQALDKQVQEQNETIKKLEAKLNE